MTTRLEITSPNDVTLTRPIFIFGQKFLWLELLISVYLVDDVIDEVIVNTLLLDI